MIDWREIADSDTWELFARDFLAELGFVIEVGPGRGRGARFARQRAAQRDVAY
jgi:hypothetical protein